MKISVIIPALNEGKNISALIEFVKCFGQDNIAEIIVVDGGSEDSTIQQAKAADAIVIETNLRSRAAQMNLGASNSTGAVLYFIHADIKLLPCFVDDILDSIKMGYSAGCYSYAFDSDKLMLKFNSFFTKFNGIFSGGGDQTLFIKREVFNELQGYNAYFSIMEDFDLTYRIRKKYGFRIIRKKIRVSARKYERNSWLRVQLANLAIFLMFFLNFNPERMKTTYNKLLNSPNY